jgi:hypothetical protein
MEVWRCSQIGVARCHTACDPIGHGTGIRVLVIHKLRLSLSAREMKRAGKVQRPRMNRNHPLIRVSLGRQLLMRERLSHKFNTLRTSILNSKNRWMRPWLWTKINMRTRYKQRWPQQRLACNWKSARHLLQRKSRNPSSTC